MDLSPDYDRAKSSEGEERIAPHEIELIKYRTGHSHLQFKLLSGEMVEGTIRWYDETAIRIVLVDRSEMTIYRHAIAYYKTRG